MVTGGPRSPNMPVKGGKYMYIVMLLLVLLTDLSSRIDMQKTMAQTSLSNWPMTDQPHEGHHCSSSSSSSSGSPHVFASPPVVERHMQWFKIGHTERYWYIFGVLLLLSRPNHFDSFIQLIGPYLRSCLIQWARFPKAKPWLDFSTTFCRFSISLLLLSSITIYTWGCYYLLLSYLVGLKYGRFHHNQPTNHTMPMGQAPQNTDGKSNAFAVLHVLR